VANFYGVGGEKYKAPPGMKPGDREGFGIICKDAWEVPHLQDLSEGMLIQLLHVKGVQGVIWCLDEKLVLAPDAPSLRDPTSQDPLFLDNTMYIHSRWGIRTLGLPPTALNALFKEEEKILRTIPTPAQCYERRNWVCRVRNERRRRSTELLGVLHTEGVVTAESEG
jgi:hypothetical protein